MWSEPLPRKSIDEKILLAEIENNWMTSLKQYIANGLLPNDPDTARKVRTTTARYEIIQGDLYCTMGDWPFLKCVSENEGSYILKEIHEGICSAHFGANTLIRKIVRYECFRPGMRESAKEMVQTCHKCQINDNNHQVPQNEYHSMSSPFHSLSGVLPPWTVPKSKGRERILGCCCGLF